MYKKKGIFQSIYIACMYTKVVYSFFPWPRIDVFKKIIDHVRANIILKSNRVRSWGRGVTPCSYFFIDNIARMQIFWRTGAMLL